MAKSLLTPTKPSLPADASVDDRLAQADSRIAQLELMLNATRAELTRTMAKKASDALTFETPILDENKAAGMFSRTIAASFGEGKVGGERRQKAYTLFMFLNGNHAILKDNQHVDHPSQLVLWLLDNMKFQPQAQ